LGPDYSSGESYASTICWSWIGGGFDVSNIKRFPEICEIRYSGTIPGRARKTSELDKAYGSENDEDGYDDYQFYESEAEEVFMGFILKFLW
jgi:hypothetical protein